MAETRPATIRVATASPHQLDRTITVGSDVGGCLISVMVRDGRLRIEVYRADDTVDVVAPGLVLPVRDMSHLAHHMTASGIKRAREGFGI